jgi:type II secretory pathway pseudopilin PulG
MDRANALPVGERGFSLIQITILLTIVSMLLVTMLPRSQNSLVNDSANAMMSAIGQYRSEGRQPIEVRFVVEDRAFFEEFVDVLRQKESPATGKNADKRKAPEPRGCRFDRDPKPQTNRVPSRNRPRPDGNAKGRS